MEEPVRLEAGKLLLFKRNGIWQARIYLGNGRYLWRSLATSSEADARRAGQRLFYQTELKVSEGLPVHDRTLNTVIDEYVALRQRDNELGKSKTAKRATNDKHTTDLMLSQITRVAKFWREYAGNRNIEAIDDKVLQAYIPWRKTYYHDRPTLPKNAKLHPADKTLQWEIMLGKMLIKFAHDQGYRGTKPLPSFTFVPKLKRVRPALMLADFERLLQHLPVWLEQAQERHRASRQLLSDYVRTLALSGLRVGEANQLRVRDVEAFTDEQGRSNVQLHVMKGKTGKRIVVPHIEVAEIIEAMLARRGEPKPEDLLFAMPAGGQIITLADQFDALLADAGMTRNSAGEKFTLYSLRHFYAVRQIARGTDIYTIARNMGTSVAMIEQYYAKHATSPERATKLGGERGIYHRAKQERVELIRPSPATVADDIDTLTTELRALINR